VSVSALAPLREKDVNKEHPDCGDEAGDETQPKIDTHNLLPSDERREFDASGGPMVTSG
jgi:hypothetical protein